MSHPLMDRLLELSADLEAYDAHWSKDLTPQQSVVIRLEMELEIAELEIMLLRLALSAAVERRARTSQPATSRPTPSNIRIAEYLYARSRRVSPHQMWDELPWMTARLGTAVGSVEERPRWAPPFDGQAVR